MPPRDELDARLLVRKLKKKSLTRDRWEQLYPDSEERLNREAEVIKPHLEWLTALPDELCIKVFGFLSKKQLHKVPTQSSPRRFVFL